MRGVPGDRHPYRDHLSADERYVSVVSGDLAPARWSSELLRTDQSTPVSGGDEPWRLPVEVMYRVQREKTGYSGRRGCILSPYQGQNGNPG